jgi:hypothetical protein
VAARPRGSARVSRCLGVTLPTSIVIGAARAGTTALHHWLDSHPDICVSRPKETHFFSAEFGRGPEHYATFFAAHRDEPAVVECTPSYLALPFVPARIASLLPAVALIAILREPVQQVYSSWWKIYSMGADRRSFAEAVAQELRDGPLNSDAAEECWRGMLAASRGNRPVRRSLYLSGGEYANAIARYDDHFRPGQLTALMYEDLVRDPSSVTTALAAAVGVNASRAPASTPPRVNETSGALTVRVQRMVRRVPSSRVRQSVVRAARSADRTSPPALDPGLRGMLADYFRERNSGLSQRIGRDLDHWGVSAVAVS